MINRKYAVSVNGKPTGFNVVCEDIMLEQVGASLCKALQKFGYCIPSRAMEFFDAVTAHGLFGERENHCGVTYHKCAKTKTLSIDTPSYVGYRHPSKEGESSAFDFKFTRSYVSLYAGGIILVRYNNNGFDAVDFDEGYNITLTEIDRVTALNF